MAALSDGPPGDPTQRLLTALGRFERQIARGRDGVVPQSDWAEECMNQLVIAVEIAVAQGWREIVRTLTQVARVLQSYEDVSQARECVPFLKESYEILCLMVGDIIVGEVRPVVVARWRKRYELAKDDLAAAGIPLVRDEDEPRPHAAPSPEPAPVPRPVPSQESGRRVAAPKLESPQMDLAAEIAQSSPPRTPRITPTTNSREPALRPEVEAEVTAAVDALIADMQRQTGSVADLEREFTIPADEDKDTYDDPGDIYEADDANEAEWPVLHQQEHDPNPAWSREKHEFFEPTLEPQWEPAPTPPVSPPPPVMEQPRAATPTPIPAAPAWPSTAQESYPETEEDGDDTAYTGVTGRRDLPSAVLDTLDTVCDLLAKAARTHGEILVRTLSRTEEALAFLEQHARKSSHDAAVMPCLAMGRLTRAVRERRMTPDSDFFELAYSFCGLYGDPDLVGRKDEVAAWIEDCESLQDRYSGRMRRNDHSGTPEAPPVKEQLFTPIAPAPQPAPETVRPSEPRKVTAPPNRPAPTRPPVEEPQPRRVAARQVVEEPPQPPVRERRPEPPQPAQAHPVQLDDLDDDDETVGSDDTSLRSSARARKALRSLFETAQRAMSEGNVANAKLLAMQAAATLAREQVRDAEQDLEKAESRATRVAGDTEQIYGDVERAHDALLEAERRVNEGETELAESKDHTVEVASELEQAETVISDLDERIRALEAERDEALRRRAAAQTRLSAAQTMESQGARKLDQRRQSEAEARARVKDTQARLDGIQKKREEQEQALIKARTHLDKQRLSFDDIQQTIEDMKREELERSAKGEYLF